MIQMLTNRVAVKPLRFNPRTPSGLYIPEQAQPRINQGIVKYIGPEVKTLKQGQWVIFNAYSGTHMVVDNEEVMILEEEFIAAVLDVPTVKISGLYYKENDGSFHEAELELAIELIALTMGEPLRSNENETFPIQAASSKEA